MIGHTFSYSLAGPPTYTKICYLTLRDMNTNAPKGKSSSSSLLDLVMWNEREIYCDVIYTLEPLAVERSTWVSGAEL